MSRKHYREFAESIKREVDYVETLTPARRNAAGAVVVSLAHNIASTCKRDNSSFRYDTFFEACGLDGYGNLLKVKK